jgi:hypothetical protein
MGREKGCEQHICFVCQSNFSATSVLTVFMFNCEILRLSDHQVEEKLVLTNISGFVPIEFRLQCDGPLEDLLSTLIWFLPSSNTHLPHSNALAKI